MTAETGILVLTACSIGFFHTLMGPDHYIPFIAMARSNRWSLRRTLVITLLCGLAHVGSSVLIGVVGLGIGALLFNLEQLESVRGEAAAWLLIGFGMAYLTWGLFHAYRHTPHTHVDCHSNASLSTKEANARRAFSPWGLFLVFAFGPCESLIPLLMYPASEAHWIVVGCVVAAFLVSTLLAMCGAVWLACVGLQAIRWPHWHRYSHALAGLAILFCGVSVKFGL